MKISTISLRAERPQMMSGTCDAPKGRDSRLYAARSLDRDGADGIDPHRTGDRYGTMDAELESRYCPRSAQRRHCARP